MSIVPWLIGCAFVLACASTGVRKPSDGGGEAGDGGAPEGADGGTGTSGRAGSGAGGRAGAASTGGDGGAGGATSLTAGAGGDAGGTLGSGGADADAGAAGDGNPVEPDPCAGVTCETPPAAECLDANRLRTYASTGTCSAGECSYAPSNQNCPGGCSEGKCNSNVWLPLSTTNGPGSRTSHTGVWTGSEMILWGGGVGLPVVALGTGARYSPTRTDPDQWIPVTTTNAPAARTRHTAVWTGSEMIVWGGDTALSGSTTWLTTGGRYSITNGWSPTLAGSTAPSGRSSHTAVWTGSEMIVWGGWDGTSYLQTGGRYDPAKDSWTGTSVFKAPSARVGHVAVWTGSVMIIWGGRSSTSSNPGPLNTGARYDPATDTWTPITTTGAPSARYDAAAVWTGTEMIVWGGNGATSSTSQPLDTGARYNPVTNTWTPISTSGAPGARYAHTAVWTGKEMIVWGGLEASGNTETGGRYDPAKDSWSLTSTVGAPAGRSGHTAIWIGSEMVVYGGSINGPGTNTGGRYVP